MAPKSYLDATRMTPDEAREHLESIRWPNGPACVRCGSVDVYRMQGKSTRPGLLKCRDCRKPFSVTVGTIFEDSHIPLHMWIAAFHLICASKKGISAKQLQRMLGLGSYKSAWHMAHRIRHAMASEPLASMLKGDVEGDEMYVGGKPRRRAPGEQARRGRGTSKQPVAVLVERNGLARARAIQKCDAATLRSFVREHVDRSSRLFTDEWPAYTGLGKEYEGGHHVVRHGQGEYARGEAHTNTAESFNGLFKRSVLGAWHHVSKQHIQRYLDEATFRWTFRRVSDAERTHAALRGVEGKRLSYRGLKGAAQQKA